MDVVPSWIRKLIIGSLFITVAIILLSAVTHSLLLGTFGAYTVLFGFGGTASLVSGLIMSVNAVSERTQYDERLNGEITEEDEKHMEELLEKSEDMELMLHSSS